jgi:hypothetical protein
LVLANQNENESGDHHRTAKKRDGAPDQQKRYVFVHVR